MTTIRAAYYARVSSEQQAAAHTIESQTSALSERARRDGTPVPPGHRNQFEVGVQQGLGRWLLFDFGYFNKHTDNGYDFGVLFDTPKTRMFDMPRLSRIP